MKWLGPDSEDQLIRAVACYLEILENDGDVESYLRTLGPLATEVRSIAGIEASLRVGLPGPTPAELAHSRRQLYEAITNEDRRRTAAGPKLIGIVGAAGLGLALGAGFASGAVPSEPIMAIVETIPFIDSESVDSEARPSTVDSDGSLTDQNIVPISTAVPESGDLEAVGAADAHPDTPGPIEGRGIGAEGTPPGQGGQNPANSNGAGTGGTPPGQGGIAVTPPGQGDDNPGNGVGSDGTPPGQGGENPGNGGGNGNGVGSDGTPPGQGGENPGNGGGSGNGVGSDGTPPGQGGENPGNGGGHSNGVGSDGTPPGQGGENPSNGGGNGNGVGNDGTPPGQGGENPGSGGGNGNGGAD